MTLNDPTATGKPPDSDDAGRSDRGHQEGAGSRPRLVRDIGWLLIPLVLVIALVVLVPSRNAAPEQSPAVGKPAPAIDLVRFAEDRSLESFSSLPEGKVTLLHFWGTWCPPCRMEYPHLAEMTQRLSQSSDFRFLPVSCEGGRGETLESLRKKTREFFASENIESPAFADPQGRTRRSAVERLEQSSLFFPTSILIDGDGKIVGVWEGYTPGGVGEMEVKIERLLG